MKCLILYNPKAGKGNAKETAEKAAEKFSECETEIADITAFDGYSELPETVVLCGGDGTLNRFVNTVENMPEHLYYSPCGSGNDFARDCGIKPGEAKEITEYVKVIPTVCVNGKEYRFINGIGFGIDGYCCQKGDEMRQNGVKEINYTAIAIKGVLFFFKPENCVVTVDEKKYYFRDTWMAPAMLGRYYGGGMMPAPDRDRIADADTLSVLVWHGKSKIATLKHFPEIFTGKHLQHEGMCQLFKGKRITVEFDKPCALQIDGETIKDVKTYTALAGVREESLI